jgi:ribulose-phosphate 3-epimerase
MINQPERFVDRFAAAGADYITVHVEATPHVHLPVQKIAAAGAVPGVALNPSTPPEAVRELLQPVGSLLIMTVNPGFGGQKFIEGMEAKVHRARELIDRSGHDVLLEVDGGINAETAAMVVRAGARLLVSGSFIFGAGDAKEALDSLKKAGN